MRKVNHRLWVAGVIWRLGHASFGADRSPGRPSPGCAETGHPLGSFGRLADPRPPAGFSLSANLPSYLIHDALIKAMPEGLYTLAWAESWTISPDAKVFEFRLRKG